MKHPTNPWGLTDRQCEVVDSLTRLGYSSRIADELGNTKPENVRLILHRACRKVGVSCSVLLALEWDRWKRSQGEGGTAPLRAGPWTPL